MVNILFPGLSLFRCSSTQWKILKVNYLNLGWHTVCSILKNFKGKRLYDLASLRISRFFTIIQEVTIKSSQKKGTKGNANRHFYRQQRPNQKEERPLRLSTRSRDFGGSWRPPCTTYVVSLSTIWISHCQHQSDPGILLWPVWVCIFAKCMRVTRKDTGEQSSSFISSGCRLFIKYLIHFDSFDLHILILILPLRKLRLRYIQWLAQVTWLVTRCLVTMNFLSSHQINKMK